MRRISWSRLMRIGLVQLRLTPEVFWALTPAELMLIAGIDGGSELLTRTGLEDLMARFPDGRRVAPQDEA